MPLHGQSELVVGEFDAFDETVGSVGGGLEAGSQVFDTLVMQAVHFQHGSAEDLRKTRPLLHADGMRQVCARVILMPIVLVGIGKLIEDMFMLQSLCPSSLSLSG